MSACASPHGDAPPSYQDALVHGILQRTGTTPFPDAPRLNPRTLDSIPDEKPLFQFMTKTKYDKKSPLPCVYEERSPIHVHKVGQLDVRSGGWQSDTSHSRSSRSSDSSLKKKVVFKSTSDYVVETNPKDCKVHPLLAYHPKRPSLILDFSKPVSRMRIAGDIPIPVRDSELDQIATTPPVSVLQVTSGDSSWTVNVRNKTGVTIRDVLNKVRDHLYAKVSQQEWDDVRQPRRDQVKYAFRMRCRASERLDEVEQRDGLRRVDLLCEAVIWRGLSSLPDRPNVWVLSLGPK